MPLYRPCLLNKLTVAEITWVRIPPEALLGKVQDIDDKTTKMFPREKMLDMFFSGGKMRSSLANLDLAKLEAFDRKYKAANGVWRTGERLLKE